MNGATRVVELGYDARRWQHDCHVLRRTPPVDGTAWAGVVPVLVLVVHRRAGKTIWCIMELLDAALKHQGRDGRYAYIAPELKQAKRNAWDYLKAYALRVPGTQVKEAELYVELPNGSRISLYGADSPDSLRGIYLDGAVLDEVAQMKADTWEAVVQIALMDRKGWAVFIGTVKKVDLLSETYFKARADTTGAMVAALYTVEQTDVFTPEEIQAKRDTMSDAHFRREFMCDFSAGGEDQLCSLELVNAAMHRSPRKGTWDFAARILGVDVAFAESGDRAVIFPRQGLMGFKPEVYRGMDNMAFAERVARRARGWDADAIMVDRGRGEGVIARMQQMGFDVLPVDFGGRPSDLRYVNKKTEMLWSVRSWLEEGGALPDDPDLRTDLCGLTIDFSKRTDRMEVLYDDNLPSPDLAAALGLTFAFPVAPRTRTEAQWLTLVEPRGMKAKRDTDPFYEL